MSWFTRKKAEELKPGSITPLSAHQFRFCYLYGFTNDPDRASADMNAFAKLYGKVIGQVGGAFIPHSFHPYQLINPAGTSVWIAAYAWLATRPDQDTLVQQLEAGRGAYPVPVASSFSTYHVWPDARLTPDVNPAFNTYVPFVIPFLVWQGVAPLQWDEQIRYAMEKEGHAGAFLAEVNEAIRFLMPSPAFLIGFDEMTDEDPGRMTDLFVNSLSLFQS